LGIYATFICSLFASFALNGIVGSSVPASGSKGPARGFQKGPPRTKSISNYINKLPIHRPQRPLLVILLEIKVFILYQNFSQQRHPGISPTKAKNLSLFAFESGRFRERGARPLRWLLEVLSGAYCCTLCQNQQVR